LKYLDVSCVEYCPKDTHITTATHCIRNQTIPEYTKRVPSISRFQKSGYYIALAVTLDQVVPSDLLVKHSADFQAYIIQLLLENTTALKLSTSTNLSVELDQASQQYEILIYNLTQNYKNIRVVFSYSPGFANLLTNTSVSLSGLSFVVGDKFSQGV
jgi:hypothetical protein